MCRGVELDPLYIDVIIRRYETISGEQSILVGTGETFDELTERREEERRTAEMEAGENPAIGDGEALDVAAHGV